jgi:dihydroorotate dehydrogenase
MSLLARFKPAIVRPLKAGPRAVIRRHASTSTSYSSLNLRTGIYATVFAISSGLFAVYYFDCRSAIHRYVFTPLLRYGLDAETGHKVAVQVLGSGLAPKDPLLDDTRLQAQVCVCICSIIRHIE